MKLLIELLVAVAEMQEFVVSGPEEVWEVVVGCLWSKNVLELLELAVPAVFAAPAALAVLAAPTVACSHSPDQMKTAY